MSTVRTHFCTDIARDIGGTDSPVKYGVNWFMPAIVSSSVGSGGIRELDGARR
jgi:hypothetical protein